MRFRLMIISQVLGEEQMRFRLMIISQVLGEAPHDVYVIYGPVFVHANFFSYILKQISCPCSGPAVRFVFVYKRESIL